MRNPLLFYRAISLLAPLCPRRTAYALAGHASRWAYRHNLGLRRTVEENLRVVLEHRGLPCSASDREPIVRRIFANFGKYMIDFFQMGRLSSRTLDHLVRIENAEFLEQCRGWPGGAIVLTAHLGNWELGANVLERFGCRVNAVVLSQESARLDALFQSRRIRRGVHVLPLAGAAISVPACLRRKEWVVLLADLDFSEQGRLVPFFGRPARLPAGPAVLAARCEAPILPVFVLRQEDGTFCFRVCPPLLPDRSRPVAETQRRICTLMETVIGEHPDQWFAFRPLWSADPSIPGHAHPKA